MKSATKLPGAKWHGLVDPFTWSLKGTKGWLEQMPWLGGMQSSASPVDVDVSSVASVDESSFDAVVSPRLPLDVASPFDVASFEVDSKELAADSDIMPLAVDSAESDSASVPEPSG